MVIVINPNLEWTRAVSGTGKEKIYRKGQFQRSSNLVEEYYQPKMTSQGGDRGINHCHCPLSFPTLGVSSLAEPNWKLDSKKPIDVIHAG